MKTLYIQSKHNLTVIIFSLFFAWILSFPFEGQVVYSIADKYALNADTTVFTAISAHFLGLFSGGFIVKNSAAARKLMLWVSAICLVGSVVFFFPVPGIMRVLIGVLSYAAGLFVASWGFYFKSETPVGDRIKTAADVLIYSNILMILINAAAVYLNAYIGLALAVLTLMGTFLFVRKLRPEPPQVAAPQTQDSLKSIAKPLLFLCIFVVVITINSGLMYQVINPAFENIEALAGWYWAVPYIIALYIMRNLPRKADRPYILYVAIAMIGFAFLFFMILDRSATSYLVVDTLMLGACGIFDLFWWSILGEMLDLSCNPAKVFGIGLSANVLGVLIGGIVGNSIFSIEPYAVDPTIIALIVVFIVLMILPLLNKSLSNVLTDHVYLIKLSGMTEEEQVKELRDVFQKYKLTDRESEIAALLLKGYTYKMIAGELFISENTVKTHLKNAYAKLGVKNKTQLMNLVENR